MKNQVERNLDFIPHSRPTLGEEEVRAVAAVIESGNIVEGEVVHRFENAFAEKLGIRHAVATSSGTAALHLILLAMGIGPDDEVIIPSYVCTALLHAVQYVRARPILAEIDPVTYNIDPDDVQKRITPRTKAIIVPHMFGLAADLDKLLKLDVPIIEDCAQAVGGTYRQKPLGTLGDAAIFSFYATKMMATGEGGMVTSSSIELIERIRDLKTYDEKEADRVRYNYKMTDVQAAIGEVQLARLDDFIDQRKSIAHQYVKSLESLSLKLPEENSEHIHYRFVVGLETDCDSFLRLLSKKGIGCARPVFLPIHRHLKLDGYPLTDHVWKTAVSVPIYPSLGNVHIERLITEFIDVFRNNQDRQ
ncbi:MAG: DegT/DnrJ/EryC1/StrS family aminotransferase [Desulfobacterales bacterium]|jgi:dTDP-4-amino-4,6-dideoxygalactose transaminase